MAGAAAAVAGVAALLGASHLLAPDAEAGVLASLRAQRLPALPPSAEIVALLEVRAQTSPSSANNRLMLARGLQRHVRASGDESRVAEIEALMREASRLRPQWNEARIGVGRALMLQHRFAEALEVAREVAASEATASLSLQADALLGLGRYDAAEGVLRELEAAGADAAVMARRAQWLEVHGRDREALELLLESAAIALRSYPAREEMVWYPYRIAEFYRLRGDLDRAAAWHDAAAELVPDHLPTALARARVAAARGQQHEARRLYVAVAERMPHVEVIGELGDVEAALGRHDAADRAWQAAIAAGEAGGEAEDRPMARFLADHGLRPEEALMRARRDLQRRQDVEAWDTLAWAAYAAGDLDTAAEAMASALRYGTRHTGLLAHARAIAAAR